MIPYIQFPSVPLFWGLGLHVFGALVALGILVGAKLTSRRGEALGLPKDDVANAIFWSVLVGFLSAHLFDVFAYQGGSLGEKLKMLANPFNGISSIGGFLGAVAALCVYVLRRGQPLLRYADSLAYGLAPGWTFGRLGCFSAHDHPGRHTSFFLAVRYPDGPRHDLGLDEALFALAITLVFLALGRKRRPEGLFVALLATLYGPIRFCLDFLRAYDVPGADPRYGGLTPAQWASIAIFGAGVWLCVRVARSRVRPDAGKDAVQVAERSTPSQA